MNAARRKIPRTPIEQRLKKQKPPRFPNRRVF
jgi:hypothetical protein